MSDHNNDAHYIKIWAILVVLLVASVVGPFIGDATGIQIITLVTAFGIAFVKAYMVAKNFMHVNVEQPVVHYFLATCLVFVVLFFASTAPDVMKQEGRNWVKNYDFPSLKVSCCEDNNVADCRLAGLQAKTDDHGKQHVRHAQCHGDDEAHGDAGHEDPATH